MELNSAELIGLEYPGRVENVDNMLKTLGGLNTISKVISTMDKKRLDLNFRPDDVFSKPISGELKPTSGLLLKVIRRRRKVPPVPPSVRLTSTSMETDASVETEQDPATNTKSSTVTEATNSGPTEIAQAASSSAEDEEPHVEIVGVVRQMFKFEGLCDFQYLAMAKHPASNKTEFIYDEIMPNALVSLDWLTDHENEPNQVPYFFPPSSFSRVDTVQEGFFKKDRSKGAKSQSALDSPESTVVGMSRNRRFKHACYIPFSLTNPTPENPQMQAVKMLKYQFVTTEQFNLVKDFFNRQPIWLRSSLAYETKIPRQKLKTILPALAYYYTTGPWRLMWVRFGYDPRKDFNSRYYQTLDYRIRSNTLKEKIAQSRKLRSEAENTYPFFEIHRLPETRQSFYRYCDVHVPKIQEMLDKIPTPISGATCNEKTGWLPPNFDDNCREILTDTINELIEQQPPDFDLSTIASTSKAAKALEKAEEPPNLENDWEYADDDETYDGYDEEEE